MTDRTMPDPSERARGRARALSRGNEEAGPDAGGHEQPASTETAGVPPLSNAELVQLQIRVIALENVITALLADATDQQRDLVRDMAAYISPRHGYTPHRLTVHAAARMNSLVEAASHLHSLRSEESRAESAPASEPRA